MAIENGIAQGGSGADSELLTLAAVEALGITPTGLWTLDDGAYTDLTSNSYDWSLGLGTHYNGATPIRGATGFRCVGNNRLDLAESAFNTNTALSLSMLFHMGYSHELSTRMIIGCTNDSPGAGAGAWAWSLWMRARANGHELYYNAQTSAGSDVDGDFDVGLSPGQAHVLGLSRNAAGTAVSLYLDGVLITQVTGLSASGAGANNELRLGAWIGDRGPDGVISNLCIEMGSEWPASTFLGLAKLTHPVLP